MGQSFERTLVLYKGMAGLSSLVAGISKAATAIGYAACTEGHGVPVSFGLLENSEWFEIESPLLETTSETSEPFLTTLAREARVPVLALCCVDSDYVSCRLLDIANGTDTVACLGDPYIDPGEPDYNAWASASKKKWKCKPEQFREIFEGDYVFAEEGLEPLAALMHFSPPVADDAEDELAYRTFWFSSAADMDDAIRPRTLLEKAADFIEAEYADKLTEKGFHRFKNSPLRWHKLVGDEGNEVLLSIVITQHYNRYEIFYGSQSLYCPMVFSDKYYPHHDNNLYWLEAYFEYIWHVDRSLFYEETEDPEFGKLERMIPFDNPEQFRPILERLILPALDKIVDFKTCHAAYMQTRLVKLYKENPTMIYDLSRMWLEAFLSGDDAATRRYFESVKQLYDSQKRIALHNHIKYYENPLIEAFGNGDMALFKELLDKTYSDNMKKLKNAGVVRKSK